MIWQPASNLLRAVVLPILCFGFCNPATNAAEKAEPGIVITAPAKLESRDGRVYLSLADGKHTYELLWARPPYETAPVILESNRVYRFTVNQEPFTLMGEPFVRDITTPKVVKVEQDGKLLYDHEICEVHKIRMEWKQVPILYGLIRPTPDQPPFETERQLFPHRRERVLGGCMVGPQKTDHMFVCHECKKAYEKWEPENLLEPKMSLQERVNQSALIAIGTLKPPRGRSWPLPGTVRIGAITVEQVLFGSFATNKALLMRYSRSRRLDPWVYTHTAPLPTVNTRCIFFVTDAGIAESPATNRLMRAVGEREHTHTFRTDRCRTMDGRCRGSGLLLARAGPSS